MADEASEAVPNKTLTMIISADSLTGSSEIGLERIRTRLLDLTKCNRLLNFRYTRASSLRVVDASLESIFQSLMNSAELPFLPVSEPRVLMKDALLPKDHADELGWNTSFYLEEENNSASGCLPVLHYQDTLDSVSRKIASAAKTVIEESEQTCCISCLERHESDDSQQSAPLIVAPLNLAMLRSFGRYVLRNHDE